MCMCKGFTHVEVFLDRRDVLSLTLKTRAF